MQARKAHKKHRQDRRAPPQDSDQDDDLSDGPDESEKHNLSNSDNEGQATEQTQPQFEQRHLYWRRIKVQRPKFKPPPVIIKKPTAPHTISNVDDLTYPQKSMLNPKKAMQKIWSTLFSGRSLSTEQIMLATMVVEKPPPPLSQAIPPMEPVTAAEAYRQLEHPTCICTTAAFETLIDPNIGHVRSVEMSLLKKLDIDQATIDLLELGPSHRMAEPPDTFRRQYRLVWTHVKVALSKLAAITTESDRVKDWQRINVAVDNWANKVDTQLSHHYEAAENHGHTTLQEAIVRIQKHFVLTISDKAPKNFTIVCKYHLDRMAYTRLASSSEIRPIPDDCQNYDETLEATKHITFTALDGREWVHAKLENTSLPTYMLLPKMIKILKCTEAGESSKHYRNVTQTHKASSCTLAELINLIS